MLVILLCAMQADAVALGIFDVGDVAVRADGGFLLQHLAAGTFNPGERHGQVSPTVQIYSGPLAARFAFLGFDQGPGRDARGEREKGQSCSATCPPGS